MLKDVPRQGWIDKIGHENPESVAEHVYMMTVIGMVLSDLSGNGTEKILKMILLHDLAESVVGDVTPGKMSKESKTTLENDAMKKILRLLPRQISQKYTEIWDEFQQNTSDESRLVHQIDKLEMALQARTYSKMGFRQEQLAPFFETARDAISEKNIKEIFEDILRDRHG